MIHLHVHHWVVWWFYVGVACGAVAIVNILSRSLTRTQDDVVLTLGVLFWGMGGLLCWAFEAIRFENPERRIRAERGQTSSLQHGISKRLRGGTTTPRMQ
jgi:hypothetical protein